MKIAILGYGKMGVEIEKIALERKHEIVLKVNHTNLNELTLENLKQADVAIEFSTPNTVVDNIKLCIDAQVPVVVGTTAWHDQLPEVEKYCKEKNGSVFYTTNFSIGVNLFFELCKQAGKLFNDYPEYELMMDEVHHTQKLDAPSGTAITTAEKLMQFFNRKTTIKNELVQKEFSFNDTKINKNELMIHSIRKELVPGTHSVYFDSEIDTIEITHTAKNRKGFAMGAVIAAEWIQGKKGIFGMKDLLGF